MLDKLKNMLGLSKKDSLINPVSDSPKGELHQADIVKLVRNGLIAAGVALIGYFGTELNHYELGGYAVIATWFLGLCANVLAKLRTDNS